MFCDEHGTADYCGECVYGPEIERLTAERDAAQAEAQALRAELQAWRELLTVVCGGAMAAAKLWPNDWPQDVAAVAFAIHRTQADLARLRDIVSGMREYADSCDHPSEASKRNAVEYWLTQLEDALSQPAEQHDPLAVSDHCPECSEPEPECVCGEQPDERESLPLMARRPRHKDDDLGELYESGKRLCTISGEPPLREPMPGFVLYRIADTDEHGLPVIERTADMPEGAKYRLTWIMQADAAGGEVEYTDSLPLALEANRSGAVSERIEDYRPAAQESGDASD